jgi:biotin carboxyl carrier protein
MVNQTKSAIIPLIFVVLMSLGCSDTQAKQPAPQPMPVKTQTISRPVPLVDEYVSTIKSRRSASIQPQVDGSLTRILVKSGDHVRAGQVLMTIDPLKQQATVDQQRSTEAQKKATYDYNRIEVERQRGLYEGGVTSKQSYDQAVQAFENSKADWEASSAGLLTQQRELAYYNLTAPFDGIVGDVPVHLGDYVSPQTLLTTVDENAHLEVSAYIPTESRRIFTGLPVQIVTQRQLIESTRSILCRSRWTTGSGTSEGADSRFAGPVSQRPVGKGASGVEHGAGADGSGAGRPADWRAVVCLRGDADGGRHGRQTACSHPRRYDWKRLCGIRRSEARGKCHYLRHPVPD